MQTPAKQNNFQKGLKIMPGRWASLLVIAVLILGGLILIGVIPLAFLNSKSALQINLPESSDRTQPDAPRAASPCEYNSATPEQRLIERLSGVEIANKNADPGYIFSLTGQEQDILQIKAPLESYSKDAARWGAESFINGMIGGENLNMLICTGVVSIVVTDGKRTWTKILKTGELIESN